MIQPIVTNIKDLRKPSVNIQSNEDISALIQDLKDTLATKNGYALTAVQIGIYKKIAYIAANNEHPEIILINPKILEKKQKIVFPESCLSFPKIVVYTDRYSLITIDNNGKTELYMDLLAIIVQHEISHMQGQTIFDLKHKAK